MKSTYQIKSRKRETNKLKSFEKISEIVSVSFFYHSFDFVDIIVKKCISEMTLKIFFFFYWEEFVTFRSRRNLSILRGRKRARLTIKKINFFI